jgi:hypothetical protein
MVAMNGANEINVLADRLTRAYEQNDTDAIVACYAPGARIWHNIDGVEQTVEEQLNAGRWLNEQLTNLRHEIVSRHFSMAATSSSTSCTALSSTVAKLSACRSA